MERVRKNIPHWVQIALMAPGTKVKTACSINILVNLEAVNKSLRTLLERRGTSG